MKRNPLLAALLLWNIAVQSQNWAFLNGHQHSSYPFEVCPDNHGGYYIMVLNDASANPGVSTFSRYDSLGNKLWQKPWNLDPCIMHMFPDGDLLLESKSGHTVMRIDKDGNIKKQLNMSLENIVRVTEVTTQGQAFVSGAIKDTINVNGQLLINNGPALKRFALLLESDFQLSWARLIDVQAVSVFTQYDMVRILPDQQSNLLISGDCGNSASVNQAQLQASGNYTYGTFLVKMDTTGQVLWHKFYSGCLNAEVSTDASNNVFVGGLFFDSVVVNNTTLAFSGNPNDKSEHFATRYSPSGTSNWLTHIGKTPSAEDLSFRVSSSGKMYFTGDVDDTLYVNNKRLSRTTSAWNNSSDLFLARLGSNGELEWYHVPVNYFSSPECIRFNNKNEVFWDGLCRKLYIGSDSVVDYSIAPFVAKMSENIYGLGLENIINDGEGIYCYPNPSSGDLLIKANLPGQRNNILIYDVSGKLVYEKTVDTNSWHQVHAPQTAGIYILEVRSEHAVLRKKLVIQ